MIRHILALCLCMAAISIVNAKEASIYSMVVGDEIWGLSESRQLTTRADGDVVESMLSPDGKYVAYKSYDRINKTAMFCTIRSSGGHSNVLMKIELNKYGEADRSLSKEMWIPGYWDTLSLWSPDSRLIAVPTKHMFFNESGTLIEDWMLTFTPSGTRQKSFLIPTGLELSGPMLWSPDARKIAAVCQTTLQRASDQSVPQDISNRRTKYDILIFDVVRGSMQSVGLDIEKPLSLDVWGSDGKSLRYLVGHQQLWEVRFDGKPGSIISEEYTHEERSPGGVFQLISDRPGVSVKKCATGEIVDITKSSNTGFYGWTPDGKMLVYCRSEAVSDEQNVARKPLRSLWLASMETHKLSHMCLALDSDGGKAPTWSRDCTKMAYRSRNRLYLAELVKKPLTTDDKLRAGLPLAEEEEKNILLTNAKMIGTALAMYKQDWDDEYPSVDNFVEKLTPYFRYPSVFFRPGTEQVVFQYFPPTFPIKNPAETIMGVIDIGRGWKIVLYVDGHARVIQK